MVLSLRSYCKLIKKDSIIRKKTKTVSPVVKTNADKATTTSDTLVRSNDDAEKENNGGVKNKLSRWDLFLKTRNEQKRRENQKWFKRPLNEATLFHGPFFKIDQDGTKVMVRRITKKNAHQWCEFQ